MTSKLKNGDKRVLSVRYLVNKPTEPRSKVDKQVEDVPGVEPNEKGKRQIAKNRKKVSTVMPSRLRWAVPGESITVLSVRSDTSTIVFEDGVTWIVRNDDLVKPPKRRKAS